LAAVFPSPPSTERGTIIGNIKPAADEQINLRRDIDLIFGLPLTSATTLAIASDKIPRAF
jgi:hypothetical protein